MGYFLKTFISRTINMLHTRVNAIVSIAQARMSLQMTQAFWEWMTHTRSKLV